VRGVTVRAPERRGTIGRGTSDTRRPRPPPRTPRMGGTRTTPRRNPSCPRATGTNPSNGPCAHRPQPPPTAPRPWPTRAASGRSPPHPRQPELHPRPPTCPRRRGGLPPPQECPRHPSPDAGVNPGPRGPARPPCGPTPPPTPRGGLAEPYQGPRRPDDVRRAAPHGRHTLAPRPDTRPRRTAWQLPRAAITRRVLDARAAQCYRFHRSPAYLGWATHPGVWQRAGWLHLGGVYLTRRRPSTR